MAVDDINLAINCARLEKQKILIFNYNVGNTWELLSLLQETGADNCYTVLLAQEFFLQVSMLQKS